MRVTEVHWALGLHRPPTASPVELGTGVLWVSTGTHPCGSPSRQDDGETRAPSLTYTGRRATIIEEMWIIDVCSCTPPRPVRVHDPVVPESTSTSSSTALSAA